MSTQTTSGNVENKYEFWQHRRSGEKFAVWSSRFVGDDKWEIRGATEALHHSEIDPSFDYNWDAEIDWFITDDEDFVLYEPRP